MTAPGHGQKLAAATFLLGMSGCAGVQSALEPAGSEAERIHILFWVLTIFCAVVFIGVAAAAALALIGNGRWRERLAGERMIIGAGIIFPIAALSLLLGYGIVVMSAGGRAAEAGGGLHLAADGQDVATGAAADAGGGLRIAVVGERWWWRVTYTTADGRRIKSANELRLPVGEPVPVELTSADVIHSFWVPKLAGKLDMIPGRINTLTLEVSEPGVSRGQCAEYCGGAHALMSFFVITMPADEFSAWLSREAAAAAEPDSEDEIQGHALFMTSGCGGCHTIRGAGARGTIGPDLTHVGSRLSLAAAVLPNEPGAFASWIRDSQHIKPENLMPPFGIFTEKELGQLAVYLQSLK